MLCSSNIGMRYTCSEFCKLWHICQDREDGKFCKDKLIKGLWVWKIVNIELLMKMLRGNGKYHYKYKNIEYTNL